jgi:hypothetical protein
MNFLHSTWFWLLIILSPLVTVAGILMRLARSGKADLPPPDILEKVHRHSQQEREDEAPPYD